jgi:hypothetical protein
MVTESPDYVSNEVQQEVHGQLGRRKSRDPHPSVERSTSRSGQVIRAPHPARVLTVGEQMIGRLSVRFRRAAGSRGRIVVEAAPSANKSWRTNEANRHREVLDDIWLGSR